PHKQPAPGSWMAGATAPGPRCFQAAPTRADTGAHNSTLAESRSDRPGPRLGQSRLQPTLRSRLEAGAASRGLGAVAARRDVGRDSGRDLLKARCGVEQEDARP